MQQSLSEISISRLARLCESLKTIIDVVSAEEQRPCHFQGPSGDVLSSLYIDVCKLQDDVANELRARSVRTYEDAREVFNCQIHILDDDEHFSAVLKLLQCVKVNQDKQYPQEWEVV